MADQASVDQSLTDGAQRPLVVVSSRSFSSGDVDVEAQLTEAGYRVARLPTDHDVSASAELLGQAHGWIAGVAPVTDDHLKAAPALRVIARYGVGVDAVDLVAAARRGIVVTNTPGANSGAVADHALGLTLALLRGTAHGDRGIRTGDWHALKGHRGREISALRVGIVGAGRIGRGYAGRMQALGAQVIAHDPHLPADGLADEGIRLVELDELLGSCDVVSLHLPGGDPLLTRAAVQTLTPGALIVNTARADLVDEAAVADGLRSGRLGGYAADSLSAEPGHDIDHGGRDSRDHGSDIDHADGASNESPLLAADLANRVVLTPHIAAQTVQAIDAMGTMAAADVIAVLSGAAPRHPVTAPGVTPSQLPQVTESEGPR